MGEDEAIRRRRLALAIQIEREGRSAPPKAPEAPAPSSAPVAPPVPSGKPTVSRPTERYGVLPKAWGLMEQRLGEPVESVTRDVLDGYIQQAEESEEHFTPLTMLGPLSVPGVGAQSAVVSAFEGELRLAPEGGLAEYAMSKSDEYPRTAGTLGLLGDMVTDPLNYVGVGAAKKVGKNTADLIGKTVRTEVGEGVVTALHPTGTVNAIVGGKSVGPVKMVADVSPALFDAPFTVRNYADQLLSSEVVRPAMEAAWDMVPDAMKPKVLDFFKSSAEKVSPELAAFLREAHIQGRAARTLSAAEGKQLDVALTKAGVPRGSDRAKDVYRYIGGETEGVWPTDLPLELQGPADSMRAAVGAELDEGMRLGIVSPANKKEHAEGLLRRHYDGILNQYGFKGGGALPRQQEIYLRNDAHGLVLDMPKDKVEEILRAKGIDPEKIPYIHEMEGRTAFKLGKDDEALRLTNELDEANKPFVHDRLRVLSDEERATLKERMDPAEATARTLAHLRGRNAVARAQIRIADNLSEAPIKLGSGRLKAPEGMMLVPDDPKWGALRNRAVKPEYFREMQGMVELNEGLAEGVIGAIDAAKSNLLVGFGTGFSNATTNAVTSAIAGNSIFDPMSWGKWHKAIADLSGMKSTGQVAPELREAINMGLNAEGVTADILGDADDFLAEVVTKPSTARKRGQLIGNLLGNSPNLAVEGLGDTGNALLRSGVGAAKGAAYGGMVGGPPGALMMGLTGAGAAPIGRALHKAGRVFFDFGDPVYQYSLYLTNLERFGGDAAKAMAETKKWVQLFSADDMPAAANFVMGRRPGAGPTERTFFKSSGPLFLGYPVNWARISWNAIKERPATAAALFSAPFIMAERLRAEAVAKGLISPEAAEKLADESPSAMVMANDTGDGVEIVPISRFFPGHESIADTFEHPAVMGLVPRLASKTFAAFTEDGRESSLAGGWQTRKAREEDSPWATILRLTDESFGGPFSGLGRVRQTLEAPIRGELDLHDKPVRWEDAIERVLFGIRTTRATREEMDEDLALDEAFDLIRAKKRARRIVKSGTTTDAEKDLAIERFNEKAAGPPR